ncbi:hypothetical protein H0E87_026554 [Populus deltoides]|uniref:Uncharacterized protein n=1 Tax=Populus deltoides TaxID=3696 RepID=A0A8T2WWM6_POPDE|nr:hypothetical protein H0E87_026554 [Populus deltoides]
MEKRRSWLWFKQRFVFSAKSTLLKLASSSRHKNRGKTELITINPYVFMTSPAFRYLSNGSICVLQPRRFHDTCKVKSNWASNIEMDLLCVELLWLWGTGNNRGLMNLGKDLETCGEYTDIQVMWKMIHSCHPIAQDTRRKRPYRKFCFRPA